MKINWKVRLKNPVFWLTAVPALVAAVYTILGLFGVVPTISEETIVNAITAIVTILTTLGVFVDPTTVGIGDSERALTYETPSKGDTEE